MKTRRAAPDTSTVSEQEIALFSHHAGDWWNEQGSFRPLHKLNPVRVEYVRDRIAAVHRRDTEALQPFKGQTLLDIGCGGGLMCEPMARLGARVTGLDASAEAIDVAHDHAQAVGLSIDYQCTTAEQLAAKGKRYHVVTALEIAEHVADLDAFIAAITALLNPGGILIVSTLNRTPKSFLLGIVAAEYLLRWVPRGTHQWRKFIKPSELAQKLEVAGLRLTDITGLVFNPLTGGFQLSKTDCDVNYFMTAVKELLNRGD